MAEDAKPWDAVFDQIRLRGHPSFKYVPPPTAAELDALAEQIGSQLPAGYRAFMTRFGAGELCGQVLFGRVVPARDPRDSVAGRTAYFRDIYTKYHPGNPHWRAGAVYFTTNVSGDSYVWNPAEVTSSDPHECRVYRIALALGELVAAGESFAEFVERVVADVNPRRNRDSITRFGAGPYFERVFHRSKKAPAKQNVKLWLASNNYTARHLALSIRDAGHTDAFPILADALQEAGCTNADLLDACRTGDPDIDGKWVLQVLLGDSGCPRSE